MSLRISPAASWMRAANSRRSAVGDLAVGGQHLGEADHDRQRRAQVVAQPATPSRRRPGPRRSRAPASSGGEMKPSRSAIAIACTRVCASSLFIALRMCVLTVSAESTSRSATCSPVRPCASRSRISRSRLDSEGCRSVERRESSAGRSRGST